MEYVGIKLGLIHGIRVNLDTEKVALLDAQLSPGDPVQSALSSSLLA